MQFGEHIKAQFFPYFPASQAKIYNNVHLLKRHFNLNNFNFTNNDIGVLHILQNDPLYPSLQPSEHTPVAWSQGSLFKQWSLQNSLQAIPKWPGLHSEFNENILATHYGIHLSMFYEYCNAYNKYTWSCCHQNK